MIGIMWVNQHGQLELVATVDRPLLFLNLLLLMFIAFMPFSPALLAGHLRSSAPDAHIAAAVYRASGVANAIGFNVAMDRPRCQVDPPPPRRSSSCASAPGGSASGW